MFNPSVASSPQIINNLIVKLVRDAHANDFTAAELKFFVLACFEMGYAEAAAKFSVLLRVLVSAESPKRNSEVLKRLLRKLSATYNWLLSVYRF